MHFYFDDLFADSTGKPLFNRPVTGAEPWEPAKRPSRRLYSPYSRRRRRRTRFSGRPAQPSTASCRNRRRQVVIDFTEGVEPAFSSIIVQNASGARVEDANVHPTRREIKSFCRPETAASWKNTWLPGAPPPRILIKPRTSTPLLSSAEPAESTISSFGMDESTVFLVALLHGFYLAMLFSGFGTTLFLVSVARPALRLMSDLEREDAFRTCLILARVSLLMSILLGIAWLGSETAVLAGANGPRQAIRALPLVILRTDFGHLLVAQISLSAASLMLARRQTWPLGAATCCACIATLLEAWHLHAAAMSDRPLLICEVAHVLACLSGSAVCCPWHYWCAWRAPTSRSLRAAATRALAPFAFLRSR